VKICTTGELEKVVFEEFKKIVLEYQLSCNNFFTKKSSIMHEAQIV